MLVIAALHLPTVHWRIPGTHTVLDFRQVVGIGAGLVVVIVVAALLIARARSARRMVKKLLSRADPAERIAGVDIAATGELARHVHALRRLSEVEEDPRVQSELAEVVARHQWEPSDDADVVELRVWAHHYYADRIGHRASVADLPTGQAGKAVSEAPTVAMEPVPAEVAPTVAVPVVPAAQDANPIETPAAAAFTVLDAGRPAGEPVPSAPPAPPAAAPDGKAVPPYRADKPGILVTGAGGAAGVTVIRALMAAGHRVVAVDTDPLAVGLRLAHAAQVIPGPADPQFATFLGKLAVELGAQAIVSTVAEEMPNLWNHRDLFDEAHLATWVPDRGVVQACIDKWLFHLAARSAGLPVPPTNLGSAEGVPGPWIVKPRFGRGSRDVISVETPEDLAWVLDHVPSPLVQSRLSGREFTVDALVARDGSFAGAVPRWRLATRGGITTQGETFTNEALVSLVENVLRGLALRGAANVQGYVSHEGNIAFTELNPRFSGGLALSLAAGADLVGQYVNGLFGLPIDPEKLRYRSGVRMLRYFEEVFEG
jgi:carbamoyl-phosphate synthase large subunit